MLQLGVWRWMIVGAEARAVVLRIIFYYVVYIRANSWSRMLNLCDTIVIHGIQSELDLQESQRTAAMMVVSKSPVGTNVMLLKGCMTVILFNVLSSISIVSRILRHLSFFTGPMISSSRRSWTRTSLFSRFLSSGIFLLISRPLTLFYLSFFCPFPFFLLVAFSSGLHSRRISPVAVFNISDQSRQVRFCFLLRLLPHQLLQTPPTQHHFNQGILALPLFYVCEWKFQRG